MSEKEKLSEEIANVIEMKFWMLWGTILWIVYFLAIVLFVTWKQT